MQFNTSERLRNLVIDFQEMRRKAASPELRVLKSPQVLLRLLRKHNRENGAVFKKNIPNDFGINTVELHEHYETAVKELRRSDETVEDYHKPVYSYSNIKQEFKSSEDALFATRYYIEHTQTRNYIETEINSNVSSRNVYKNILKNQIRAWDDKIDHLLGTVNVTDDLMNNIGNVKILGTSKNKEVDPAAVSYANYIHIFALNKQKALRGKGGQSRLGNNTTLISENNFGANESFLDNSFGNNSRVGGNHNTVQYYKQLSVLIDNFIDLNDNRPIKELLVDIKRLLIVYIKSMDSPDLVGNLIKASCDVLGSQAFSRIKMMLKPQRVNKIEDFPNLNSIVNFIEGYIITKDFDTMHRVQYDDNNIPIWALIYYSIRFNCLKDLKEFLDDYSGNMIQEIRSVADLVGNILRGNYSGAMNQNISNNEDVFRMALSSLLSRNSTELPEDFLIEGIDDYIWFRLFKVLLKNDRASDLKELHNKLRELKDSRDSNFTKLEMAKYQLLCLMFPDLLETLRESDEFGLEGCHLGFLFLETGVLSNLKIQEFQKSSIVNPSEKAMLNITEFAQNISKRLPVESFSYFACINSPLEKSAHISKFLTGNSSLFDYIFGPNNQHNLQRIKENLGNDVYELLLEDLSKSRPAESDKFYVCRLRVLEELGAVDKILQLIVDQELILFTKSINSKKKDSMKEETSVEVKNAFHYLDKLFDKHNADKDWRTSEVLYQAIIAKKIRKLANLYMDNKPISELMDYIRQLDFFDNSHFNSNNKLKIMILQAIEICLSVISKYLSNLKPHSLNYDVQLRAAQKQLKRINDFYNEHFRESVENIFNEKGCRPVQDIAECISKIYHEILSTYKV